MAALLALTACSGDDGSTGGGQTKSVSFPDSVVDEDLLATVNSRPIRGRDLRVFTIVYQSGTSDSLRDRAFNEKILDGLIDRTLLLLEAEAIGVSIDDSTQKWYLREFTRAVGGEEAMTRVLSAGGFARHEMEQLVRQDLTIRKFLETNVAVPVDVPDSLAMVYYGQNESQFWTPDSVHARHIIIRRSQTETELDVEAKTQTLRDLRERVLAGEEFAELAKLYSEGPSAPRGGDLGYFTARDMVATFSNAAFNLEPGGVSDVVATPFGYHIIQVIDKKPRRKLPYDEIAVELKQQIAQFYVEQTLQNHLQRSRAVAIIEKNY
jgi:parvulin-like peptidyl-prolyl isomerase